MAKGISAAVDALRGFHPNTRVTISLGGQRFGVQVDARNIVQDFDSVVADRDFYRAEAEKWQGLAQRLADKIAP